MSTSSSRDTNEADLKDEQDLNELIVLLPV